MKIVKTIASVETHERLVVELECGVEPILSLCRVTKESDDVNVEFDLSHQGGGVVSVSFAEFVERLHAAEAELRRTYPEVTVQRRT
ncbi:MAG: hypothetical protein GQE15_03205 [Archangiaceae bacterium]|nr:hypothetical protein [Archangiaceae bacterium]